MPKHHIHIKDREIVDNPDFPRYQACVNGGFWRVGSGDTPAHAVGRLIMLDPEFFGLKVEMDMPSREVDASNAAR